MTAPKRSAAATLGPSKPDTIFGARSRDELEFLPAALEVVETPPPPLPRVIALSLVGLLVLTVLWAVLGRVDVVATAPGQLIPTGGGKIVQPLESGTVTAIHVRDGMVVERGQVLVELEPTETLANWQRTSGELAAARLELARQRSIALGEPFHAPLGDDRETSLIAARETSAEIANREARLQGLAAQIEERRAALSGAQAEVDRLETILPLDAKRTRVFEALAAKGYASTLQLIEATQKEQNTAKSLEVQRKRILEIRAQIGTAERALAEARASAAKSSLAALAEAQVKAGSLSEEANKAERRLKDRTLVAPVDGTVQELAIHTIGGVVGPGQVLMRIAPSGAGLEVEAKLANREVGFVRAGMPVEIKVEAFPFTRYGLIPGRVQSVSSDALAETPGGQSGAQGSGQGAGQDGLRYLVRIKLERDTMVIDGKSVRLTPGMIVSAEIKTGRRRIIDYVFSPLAKATHEAGRER